MNFKTLGYQSLLVLSAFVLFINYGFSQSTNVECPDCSKEQIKYDSISSIYSKSKKELKSLEAIYKKSLASSESDSMLTETKTKLDKLKSSHTLIKEKYQQIVSALDACLAADRSGECAECKNGKLEFKEGAPCDDGDPCTKNDRCVNGVCIGDPVTSNENPECAGGKK